MYLYGLIIIFMIAKLISYEKIFPFHPKKE